MTNTKSDDDIILEVSKRFDSKFKLSSTVGQGSVHAVYLLHAGGRKDVYVRLQSQRAKFEKFSEMWHQRCVEIRGIPFPPEEEQVGSLCGVLSHGLWHRGVLLNMGDSQKRQYRVHLLDFGLSVTVADPKSDVVFVAEKDVLSHPLFAIRCKAENENSNINQLFQSYSQGSGSAFPVKSRRCIMVVRAAKTEHGDAVSAFFAPSTREFDSGTPKIRGQFYF